MDLDESNDPTDDTNRLAEQPLGSYLGGDEALLGRCYNESVGVRRVEDEQSTIAPASDCGAEVGVTDRRVVVVVGDPPDHGGDFAATVPYREVRRADVTTETLTRAITLETCAGVRWSFPVRGGDDPTDLVAIVSGHAAEHRLADARQHRAEAADCQDRDARIDALEAALAAFQEAASLLDVADGADADATADREDAEAVIADLVAAHLDRGRSERSRGNWFAEAGDDRRAREAYANAADAFDRALSLSTSYPPGDPETIEDELMDLAARRKEYRDSDVALGD
ncbi:MAG: hypothetical protein ABEJ05_13445 [Haloglomus sp.]